MLQHQGKSQDMLGTQYTLHIYDSVLQAQEPLLALQDDETEPQAPPDDMRAGMLWYFSSSFFFAGMGICSKFLGNWGYPVFEITFFRSIIIACFSLSALSSAGAPL